MSLFAAVHPRRVVATRVVRHGAIVGLTFPLPVLFGLAEREVTLSLDWRRMRPFAEAILRACVDAENEGNLS